MPDPIARSDRSRTLEDQHEDAPRTPRAPARAPREMDWNAGPVSPAVDQHLNASLGAYAKNKNVMMLGMNEDTTHLGRKQNDAEWAAVRTATATTGGKAVRIDASYGSQIESDGQTFELNVPGQGRAFAASLHIEDPKVTQAIGDAIENAEPMGRDELARIAQQWACAERPGTMSERVVPSRILLSGHCGGTNIYDGAAPPGMENTLALADIQKLASAMPHAAAQVTDIMFSACSTMKHEQKEAVVDAWRGSFPNLRSMQAYGSPVDYHSPTGQTAIVHEQVWLNDTRGSGTPHIRRESELAFASHTMIWTQTHGFEEGK